MAWRDVEKAQSPHSFSQTEHGEIVEVRNVYMDENESEKHYSRSCRRQRLCVVSRNSSWEDGVPLLREPDPFLFRCCTGWTISYLFITWGRRIVSRAVTDLKFNLLPQYPATLLWLWAEDPDSGPEIKSVYYTAVVVARA